MRRQCVKLLAVVGFTLSTFGCMPLAQPDAVRSGYSVSQTSPFLPNEDVKFCQLAGEMAASVVKWRKQGLDYRNAMDNARYDIPQLVLSVNPRATGQAYRLSQAMTDVTHMVYTDRSITEDLIQQVVFLGCTQPHLTNVRY